MGALAASVALTGLATANPATASSPASSPASNTAVAHRSETLGPFGYGGVRLGMSAKEARATGRIVRKQGASLCSGWDLKAHPTGRDFVGLYISKKLGVALISAPKGVGTPEGIGIGSTRKQLRKAYPKLQTTASGSKDHLYVQVPGNPKADYRFLLDHNKIYEVSLELKNQDCTN
ncbi:hypothetical protein [Nonomuraea sp. NPDC050786]|uniref:hypothetical protein n=1 Tax=Nonomuraea sp. NPDC050786 TaxID=3154840 RepID=UPI0033CB957C